MKLGRRTTRKKPYRPYPYQEMTLDRIWGDGGGGKIYITSRVPLAATKKDGEKEKTSGRGPGGIDNYDDTNKGQ